MIGTRTPFRMSFIGGGSDIEEFYTKSSGAVISTTINKYMYIFVHNYFNDSIQLKYSRTELVNHIDKIKHPIAREVIRKFNLKGVDINSIADMPAGTGLGSSSSYTVGLLNAIYKFTNQSVSPETLAREACEIEINILKEPIGKQDQYAAAYGGLNLIKFHKSGRVEVSPIKMCNKAYKTLQNNLILYYTGKTRSASKILHDQKNNIINDNKKFDLQKKMSTLVISAKEKLLESNLEDFAKILDKNWQLKKSLSKKVSNKDIDCLYDLGKKNGAIGGKLLGAGGSGFILFYCEKNKQSKLRQALNSLKEYKFKFDDNGSVVLEMSQSKS